MRNANTWHNTIRHLRNGILGRAATSYLVECSNLLFARCGGPGRGRRYFSAKGRVHSIVAIGVTITQHVRLAMKLWIVDL